MNQFINKHPWMTFFLLLGGLSVISMVATAHSISSQINAAVPTPGPLPSNPGTLASVTPVGLATIDLSLGRVQPMQFNFSDGSTITSNVQIPASLVNNPSQAANLAFSKYANTTFATFSTLPTNPSIV